MKQCSNINHVGIHRGQKSGFALLIVLLIVAVLTGMVTEFMFSTKLNAELGANYRDRVKARYLARSAVNAFQYLLEIKQIAPGTELYSTSSWVGYGSGFAQIEGGAEMGAMLGMDNSPISPSADGPLRGQWSIGIPAAGFDVDGNIHGRIVNERGKINLNAIVKVSGDRLQDAKNEDVYNQLRTLMELRGIMDEDADICLDSLLDWIDQNSGVEPNGAEEDYYRGLEDNPYYARNDFLLSLDELRLVRGCTPDIVDKIKDYVTVFPKNTVGDGAIPDARIDPASAPKMVLMALFLAARPSGSDTPINDPDTASTVADEIYAKALEKASLSVTVAGGSAQVNSGQGLSSADVTSVIAGRLQGTFNFYQYSGFDPQYFTAIGGGEVNGVLSVTEAVFRTEPNKVEIIQWTED